MIYSLFLYQSQSGLLLFDKSFQDVSEGRLDMFSAFFAALKSFISEMVLSGSKELKTIELGDYFVLITHFSEVDSDLVIIADKDDFKSINKLIPKINKIIFEHKELFINWNQNIKQFKILDKPLTDLIISKKKLIEGTPLLVEQQQKVLKSIWSFKKDISPEIKLNLTNEKQTLKERLSNLENLNEKLILIKKLIEITEKLKDDQDFIHYQHVLKKINDDIKDKKFKVKTYLERIKSSLSYTLDNLGMKSLKEGDYKETYLNLYSFSAKLKFLTEQSIYKKYQILAKKLIDKDETDIDEFTKVISEILSMKDDIEGYIS